MAVSKFKTFVAGEILLASDLNSSFDQVFNNGEDLGFPRTKDADFNGNALILDADGDSEIVATLDDIAGLKLRGISDIFKWDGATPAATLANGLTFLAAKATVGPSILAQGTDANIDINITPKGTGVVTIANLTINIFDDKTPQLGANLDTNSFDIQFDDNTGIRDDSGNEWVIFQKAASATSFFEIRNSTAAPSLTVQGDDADISLNLFAKGTGDVRILDPQENSSIMVIDPSPIAVGTVRRLLMADADVDLADLTTALQQGKDTIFVPAAAMTPTVSNGCSALTLFETTAGRPDIVVLDFDQTADEGAQFQVALPKKYNGGTVTFQLFWTQSVGAVTTGVAFALQGVAVDDNQTIDVAYGTPVVVTDDAQGAVEEMYISVESSAITIAGTPTGSKMNFFRLFRDVSDANDDLAGDARVVGIKFHFTTNANTDA